MAGTIILVAEPAAVSIFDDFISIDDQMKMP